MADKLVLPPLPDRGSVEAVEYLAYVNTALRRVENLLIRVRKFGDFQPLFELHFEGGTLIRVPSRALAGTGLVDVFTDVDGSFCPSYTRSQCTILRAALIRSAEVCEADDERSVLVDDLDAFLKWTLEGANTILVRPDGRDEQDPPNALYRAVGDLRTLNQDRSGHPSSLPPVLAFWIDAVGQAELWVPRGALAEFLRARRYTTGRDLRNLIESLHWRRREIQPRGSTGRRAHVRVWSVPVPWDGGGEVDLADVFAGTQEHSGPLRSNAREDGTASRVRGGSTVFRGSTPEDEGAGRP